MNPLTKARETDRRRRIDACKARLSERTTDELREMAQAIRELLDSRILPAAGKGGSY